MLSARAHTVGGTMRKYVLTDPDGRTPKGLKLAPGKFIEQLGSGKDLLQRLGDCCGDTPLVAVLLSPFSTRPGSRLFQINCWKVSVDPREAQSYTVVKEVRPVPAVTLEQKIRFALLALSKVYKQKDFAAWARSWLAGEDRSPSAARAQRESSEREIAASAGLESLAAWSEGGSSDTQFTERMAHLAQAVRHTAAAAELATKNPPETDQAAEALAQAFAHLCRAGQPLDLAALAEEAVGSTAPQAVRTGEQATRH
jgi:hypothetical protein